MQSYDEVDKRINFLRAVKDEVIQISAFQERDDIVHRIVLLLTELYRVRDSR